MGHIKQKYPTEVKSSDTVNYQDTTLLMHNRINNLAWKLNYNGRRQINQIKLNIQKKGK